MKSLLLILVVIGALFVIASGIWVATALLKVVSRKPSKTAARRQ
jgi:preprotein translocase subunit SecF